MFRNLFTKSVNVDRFKGDVIVLDQYQAIYFAIPKVANSSMKAAIVDLLRDDIPACCYDDRHKTRAFIDKSCKKVLRDKRILVRQLDEREARHWKFALVRNPIDRLRSCYAQKIKMSDPSGLPLTNDRFESGVSRSLLAKFPGVFTANMCFADFVDVVCQIPDHKADKHFAAQTAFVCDRQGRLLVDYVGKLENLTSEFEHIKQHCGLPANIELPHRNRSSNKKLDIIVGPTDLQKVKIRYAGDYELFGYS